MITTCKGNIFDEVLSIANTKDKEALHIIVHGCNNKGVMGSGIAKEVKTRFKNVFDEYKLHEKVIGLSLGDISLQTINNENQSDVILVNAITQDGYGKDGARYVSYDAIEVAFSNINVLIDEMKSIGKKNVNIYFPKIGAGLGGGNWEVISTIIDTTIKNEVQKFLFIL